MAFIKAPRVMCGLGQVHAVGMAVEGDTLPLTVKAERDSQYLGGIKIITPSLSYCMSTLVEIKTLSSFKRKV